MNYFSSPIKQPSLKCKSTFFSPLGLVPEVPLLQAFENDEGRGWTRFVVAGLAVICLNITLLELSLPLHALVSLILQNLNKINANPSIP